MIYLRGDHATRLSFASRRGPQLAEKSAGSVTRSTCLRCPWVPEFPRKTNPRRPRFHETPLSLLFAHPFDFRRDDAVPSRRKKRSRHRCSRPPFDNRRSNFAAIASAAVHRADASVFALTKTRGTIVTGRQWMHGL